MDLLWIYNLYNAMLIRYKTLVALWYGIGNAGCNNLKGIALKYIWLFLDNKFTSGVNR